MEKLKENSEILVLLLIIFFIFVTLVIFYENKLEDNYYNNKYEYLTLELEVKEKINKNIIKINDDYVNLRENLVLGLNKNYKYTFKFKTNKKLIRKGDLNSLFKYYKIEEIH